MDNSSIESAAAGYASHNTISAPCPYVSRCGGCALQHIDYKMQLAEKEKKLNCLLSRCTGIKKIPAIEIIPSEPYGYRERFQFHRVDVQKNKTPVSKYKPLQTAKEIAPAGFSAYHSNNIIPIDDCLLAAPVIRKALREKTIKPPLDKDRWTVYGRGELLLQEGGTQRGTIQLCGKLINVDAALFFQSNSALLEKLIDKVLSIANDADKTIRAGDFYCGVGTFAVFLQDIFPKLDLLEENPAAIKLAKENLRANTATNSITDNTRFFALTDNQWVRKIQKSEPYSFLCVDPSRQGLSPAMRTWLCEQRPTLLAYISCEPSALTRDLKDLCAAGYELEALTLYDFYPQTEHIETLAVLRQ
jgi:23S rRNA (uracil1939-C5)-methyltransferase